MYSVVSILWLFLVWGEIELGPDPVKQVPGEDAALLAAD